MVLRLTEQACGCSTVQDVGRLKVRARVRRCVALGWRVLAATIAHLVQVCLAIVIEPAWSSD